jgi:hypothetical protein
MALPTLNSRPEKTIEGYLSRWNAANLPLQYELENTKWPDNTENDIDDVNDVDDNASYARFTLNSTTETYEVGLYVEITNTTSYNGIWRIREVDTLDITLDVAYVADETGNMQIYYNNYTTIARVYAGIDPTHSEAAEKPVELIGTIEQRPDTDNLTKVNVQKYIKAKLNTEYDESQSSWPNDLNGWTDFYISYAERYDQISSDEVVDFTSAFTDDEESGSIVYCKGVNGALQFGSSVGGNMAQYVVDLVTYKDIASWMTFFERPKIIDGSKLQLSIIAMSEFTLNIIQLDQNGNILDNSDQSINWKDYGLYRLEPSIVFDEDVASIQISGEIGAFGVTEIIEVDVDNDCIGEGLPAPTLFAFNTPTTTTLDFSFTSNSGGSESGFEVQLSLLSDFSVIEQTDNLASGITTGQFTGLTDGTIYYGRVRANGAIDSAWSNTDNEETLFANPLELFGANLHAWFRSDDVVLNGTAPTATVSQWNDKSGNARHLVQATAADQLLYSDGRAESDSSIDGHKTLYPKDVQRFLEDNGSWAGLGTSNYFVVIVCNRLMSAGSVIPKFSRNEPGDDSGANFNHGYWAGSGALQDLWSMDSGLSFQKIINRTAGATDSIVDAIKMSTSSNEVWRNGAALSGDVDFSGAAGAITDSFDSLILGGQFADGSGSPNGGGSNVGTAFAEIFWVSGVPEDYPTEFNRLHTGYLNDRYPSLSIVDPNLS